VTGSRLALQQYVIAIPDPHHSSQRVKAKSHEERHELVRPGANRNTPQRAEWRGTFPEREVRRLPKQMGTDGVREIICRRKRKRRGAYTFLWERVADEIGEPFVNGDDLIARARQRPKQEHFVVFTRKQYPLTISTLDDGTWLHNAS